MRVLITGATGFIGSNLVKSLFEAGYEVHALVRDSNDSEKTNYLDGISWHSLPDQNRQVFLTKLVEESKPDVVIHAATKFISQHSPTDILDIVDSNITFGTFLLDAMKNSGLPMKFINLNSAWQFFDETPGSTRTLYSASKNAFGEIVKYYLSTSKIIGNNLVLFDTYGIFDNRRKIVDKLVESVANDEFLPLSKGNQLINLTHISDVCKGVKILMGSSYGNNETFQLKSPETISIRSLASLIEEISGKEIAAKWGALPDRPFEMLWDWNVAPNLPGWSSSVTLRQGLKAKLNELDIQRN